MHARWSDKGEVDNIAWDHIHVCLIKPAASDMGWSVDTKSYILNVMTKSELFSTEIYLSENLGLHVYVSASLIVAMYMYLTLLKSCQVQYSNIYTFFNRVRIGTSFNFHTPEHFPYTFSSNRNHH